MLIDRQHVSAEGARTSLTVDNPEAHKAPPPEAAKATTSTSSVEKDVIAEKVSEQLKEQLRQSSVKIWREAKDGSEPPIAFCDGNIVSFEEDSGGPDDEIGTSTEQQVKQPIIAITTAAHCVDKDYDGSNGGMDYPIQDALRAEKDGPAAVNIAPDIPYKFSIYNHGDKPGSGKRLTTIDMIVENSTGNHSELVLMRPERTSMNPDMQARAIPAKFGEPQPGQEIFFVGEPDITSGRTTEATMTYIGKSHQYDRNMAMHNAILAPTRTMPVNQGSSGGAGITAEGLLITPWK